ncbi:site-specific DNA-methyltransferase [Herbaspirillum sp. SJZ107]|uniref:DNA-methyltransferase n=1 Tax=Herbaspirillum sp. SJZ107 TaxID=2572881 RepID=UPI001152D303|nr:site-specific DNA-methyltransferase [Herbaspirillum sp. SJZ107]TQK10221.1 site-specific DNA-methyltransferase (adenine-specific) [Herbaspirillum sp. SJZ107]
MRDLNNEAPAAPVPFVLHLGDCLEVMRGLDDSSVDAIVTDPPYELGFMGKSWDASGIANSVEMWREALRVLKPGGHLLAFSGSRTYHRMTVAIEDAGFEIRDQIMWVYGSGFPKSRDISKDMDRMAGVEREVIGTVPMRLAQAQASGWGNSGADNFRDSRRGTIETEITAPATDAARHWAGWGTALKPAHEPICVARKPLAGTVAANVLANGVGALNIDGCRVGTDGGTSRGASGSNAGKTRNTLHGGNFGIEQLDAGRWPANLIHDGSTEVVALFPVQESGSRAPSVRKGMGFHGADGDGGPAIAGSIGSAARFFYCAKASRADRNEGCPISDVPAVSAHATMREREVADWPARNGNHHPTVKPTDLMAYLVRLVTPPGGVVLDPFMGSGSTGKACMREGFRFIGIDMTPEYVEIARARIEHELAAVTAAAEAAAAPAPQRDLFEEVA